MCVERQEMIKCNSNNTKMKGGRDREVTHVLLHVGVVSADNFEICIALTTCVGESLGIDPCVNNIMHNYH